MCWIDSLREALEAEPVFLAAPDFAAPLATGAEAGAGLLSAPSLTRWSRAGTTEHFDHTITTLIGKALALV